MTGIVTDEAESRARSTEYQTVTYFKRYFIIISPIDKSFWNN